MRFGGRIAALVITLAVLAAGCGDDDALAGTPATTAPTTTASAEQGGSAGSASSLPSTSTAPSTTAPTATTVTATPPAGAGTRADPIPAGVPVVVGQWEVIVLSATPDATAMVMAENPYNDPPDAGNQFFFARIAATYLGEGSQSPFGGLTFSAVGDLSVGYDFDSYCGVIPDEFPDFTEVFSGGTVVGNLCWGVAAEDAESLLVIAEPAFEFGSERFFLSVPEEGIEHQPPTGPVAVAGGDEPGSRGNPIAVGETGTVGTWEISVLASTPDATALVMAENPYNDPPTDGHQFAIIEVSATNRGIESGAPFTALTFSVVGNSAVAYGSDAMCGVIPDDFPDFTEVFTGGTVTGNLCWSVTTDDAGSLILMVKAAFGFDEERVFFEIS